MFEAQPEPREYDVAERLEDLLPKVRPAPERSLPAQPEARGFELPARIWVAMIACYALFFTTMTIALGSSGKAMLSIMVAAVYVVVFFGAARAVTRQNPAREMSPIDRSDKLLTHCGLMDRRAVYGQILVVPIAVALFGIAVSTIIMALGVAA